MDEESNLPVKLRVAITTLTNRTTIIELDADSTIAYLKSLYQDKEGVPPDQQRLLFPVNEGTDGAKKVTEYSWWTSNVLKGLMDDGHQDLATSLARDPLLQSKGFMTIGDIVAKADAGNEREDGAAQCFVVLQLRPSLDDEEYAPSDPNAKFEVTEQFGRDIAALDKEFAAVEANNAKEAAKADAALDVEFMSEGDADEVLEKAFKTFDTDGSGKLSAAELMDILTRVGVESALSEEDAKQVVAKADVNDDGELDISEFIKLMKGMQL